MPPKQHQIPESKKRSRKVLASDFAASFSDKKSFIDYLTQQK